MIKLIFFSGLILLLVVMAIIDFKKKVIPDKISFFVSFFGFILAFFQERFWAALFCGLIMFAIAFCVYVLKVWEGGDVKIIAALGVWLQFPQLIWFIWMLFITDLIWLFIYRTPEQRKAIPYGPAILLSFLGALIA